ncbi:hypothetical protein [Flavobacterium caeni]|uniref:Uncharacterized protein n=1 Tax=Flavobacterium caeni TaxID=490189 RepID=A0A1G5KJ82_9FLAO|nr:hypothetical protein [Flavobacterium caeni]SCZ00434.1 hypothetical protein SAMN02927903_03330 [Flavobacterium caeni]
MRPFFAFIVLLFSNNYFVFGQDSLVTREVIYKSAYPEGVYITKSDFLKKTPSQVQIVPKGLIGFKKPVLAESVHNCYFYYLSPDKRIKDAFAVSYDGYLYFQINAILKNRHKDDDSQTNSFPNSFVRVLIGGDNFLYTEADLANVWAKGAAYGGVGGGVGVALANKWTYGKGIVWDFANSEFNIFRNCKDFNEFIKNYYENGIQECKKNQPETFNIREIIEKIK